MNTESFILLVDDDPADTLFMLQVLEASGIPDEILMAETHETAIEHPHRHSGSIRTVFVDVRMPGADGFELLQRIHGDPAWSQLKVVMLSGASDPAHLERARTLGASGFLEKFPTPQKAAGILANVLASK